MGKVKKGPGGKKGRNVKTKVVKNDDTPDANEQGIPVTRIEDLQSATRQLRASL